MPRRRDLPEVPLHLRIAVTVAEAGALLGKGDDFVRQQIAAGRLATIPHATGCTMIAVAALHRWADDAGVELARAS
jgi:hypothetical protein